MPPTVIFDTNILVAGLRSSVGASHALLRAVAGRYFELGLTVANVDDAVAAPAVLAQLDGVRCPGCEVVWADSKYHNHALNAWKASRPDLPWRIEVVSRPPGSVGFHLLPKRWVVERTIGWLGRARRPSRDDERRIDSSACMVRIRGIQVLLDRMAPKGCRPPDKYKVANI